MNKAVNNFANGVSAIILVCVAYMAYQYASLIGAFILVVVAGSMAAGAGLGLWYAVERIRKARAERMEAEKKAAIEVVSHSGFVGIRDTSAHYKRWQVYPAARAINYPDLLPSGQPQEIIEPDILDLMTVFTQPTQSYAIIGGQQTGKTFQARHVANYWLRQGIQPLVIGPKWDRGEWDGCLLVGGNGDFESVGYGLALVRLEAEKRHGSQIPHKQHKILPIFFDDWTPIVNEVPDARQLILEATTLYASVNIILYFILHSDTAHAWGVDRKGAALKDNFIKLFIEPFYDESGLVVRNRTRGYLRFGAETIDRPTRLFSTVPHTLGRAAVLTKEQLRALVQKRLPAVEVEPTEDELEVLAMVESGASKSAIARAVFGGDGGNQLKKVKEILEKYARSS